MQEKDSKWKVSNQIEINLPSSAVWDLISTPCYLLKVHPHLSANECKDWSGVGSTDIMTYPNGSQVHRTVKAWMEGVGLDLQVEPYANGAITNQAIVPVEWRISPLGEKRSELKITVYPFRMKGKRGLKAIYAYYFRFKPMYKTYFIAVLKGIKHHLETGEIVQEDQFGYHPYFSAAKG